MLCKAPYAKIQLHMDRIDTMDEQLVRLLGRDAKQNSEALARQLGLSAATVRRRLRKLIQRKLLRIVGVIDPADFGFPVAAVISLDVAHNKLESAMLALAELEEMKWVSSTTGRFDVMALGRFRSTEDLSRFVTKVLAHIKGVKNVETFVCLDIRKGRRIAFGQLHT